MDWIFLINLIFCLVESLPITSKPIDNTPEHLAWEAWIMIPPSQNKTRRITPKSIFILPNKTLSTQNNCPPGHVSESGSCIQTLQINSNLILLNHLANVLNNTSYDFDYDYGEYAKSFGKPSQEENDSGPLKFDLMNTTSVYEGAYKGVYPDETEKLDTKLFHRDKEKKHQTSSILRKTITSSVFLSQKPTAHEKKINFFSSTYPNVSFEEQSQSSKTSITSNLSISSVILSESIMFSTESLSDISTKTSDLNSSSMLRPSLLNIRDNMIVNTEQKYNFSGNVKRKINLNESTFRSSSFILPSEDTVFLKYSLHVPDIIQSTVTSEMMKVNTAKTTISTEKDDEPLNERPEEKSTYNYFELLRSNKKYLTPVESDKLQLDFIGSKIKDDIESTLIELSTDFALNFHRRKDLQATNAKITLSPTELNLTPLLNQSKIASERKQNSKFSSQRERKKFAVKKSGSFPFASSFIPKIMKVHEHHGFSNYDLYQEIEKQDDRHVDYRGHLFK